MFRAEQRKVRIAPKASLTGTSRAPGPEDFSGPLARVGKIGRVDRRSVPTGET